MKLSKTLYTALFALSFIPPAQAETMTDDIYLSVDAGMIAVRDAEYDYNDGVDHITGDVDLDNGYQLSIAVGKRFTDYLRSEIELGYSRSDLDIIAADGLGSYEVTGEIKTVTGLVNGYVDLMPGENINPFVTAGIGVARHTGEITSIAGIGLDGVDANATVFAYQLGIGATVNVKKNTNMQIGYRYQGTSDADFDGMDTKYGAHALRAGLRFDF